jgi:hypothetical protein
LLPNWEWKSETRNGTVAVINKFFKRIYSDRGLELLCKINSQQDLVNYSDLLVEWNEKIDNKEVLNNLSNRGTLGFVMSCMQINDWRNDHAVEDQLKGKLRQLSKLNKKALVTRLPTNLDSSKSIPFLVRVMTKVIK